ncbi:MAG TPA: HipA family kinase [Polyangia bacterium]|nr:HipA family kinase [Polyangia bacterium]
MRYVTALREGGSVPAVVEADDGSLYVAKFRAAAQGGRVLAAELIVGELGRAAGLRVPELALIEIDAALGRSEPHQEIQELLIASAGTNLAMAYLAGAVGYDVAARRPLAGELASAIVALDLFAANVDRTARNPNLLWWQGELWLIDHGASLFWQHGWDGQQPLDALAASAARAFDRAGDHVLLPLADRLPAAGAALAAAVDDGVIDRVVAAVPDVWLEGPGADKLRAAYGAWLRGRRAALPHVIEEADRVRATRV